MTDTPGDVHGPRLLLTVDEAAARLHLSRPTIYDLINSGQLRSFKVGRARRIPVHALDEYVTAQLKADGAGAASSALDVRRPPVYRPEAGAGPVSSNGVGTLAARSELPRPWTRGDGWQAVAYYEYRGADDRLLCEKVRFERKAANGEHQKTFAIRRPDPERPGAIRYDAGDERAIYRLPEVIAARDGREADGMLVFTEGEKDADRLAALGLVTTTHFASSPTFTSQDLNALRGFRQAAVLEDNDAPGRKHALKVATQLRTVIDDVRIVSFPELPEHGDVSDYLDGRGTLDELWRRVDAADSVPAAAETRPRDIADAAGSGTEGRGGGCRVR